MLTKSHRDVFALLIIAVFLCIFLSAGAAAIAAEGKKTSPIVNYANAGVSMSLPKGFEPQVAPDPSIVVRASLKRKGQSVQAITLSAY